MNRLSQQLQRLYVDGLIWSHYGTRNPERIPLVNSEQHLYVNPRDWRARKKLIVAGLRGRYPRNQKFFQHAVRTGQPDTVLDIGLNYGECLLSLSYAAGTRLFGFDANAGLRPYVERTLAEHPNREQIEILSQLVSDGDEGVEEFFIDEHWSGGSAAGLSAEHFDPARHRRVQIPRSSIDTTLARRNFQPQSLFFKIDVEGYEPKVLAGMTRTLAQASSAIGFIEFNGVLLARSGTEVADYWNQLRNQFEIYAFDPQDDLHAMNGQELDGLRRVCGKYFRTDLILLRGVAEPLREELLRPWRTGEAARRAA